MANKRQKATTAALLSPIFWLQGYLTKNHYWNYSPKMVPIARIRGSGSWTIIPHSFPALLITYKTTIQNLVSMLIQTYFDKQNSMFPWNLHLCFHGIPLDFSRSKVPRNSVEVFQYSLCPWNSMELLIFPKNVPWNFLKFHRILWNFRELEKIDIKTIRFLKIVVMKGVISW